MSDDHLDHFLARFVAEVRKVDGKEYPEKTIYEMINSIQTYLRVECKRNLTLIDKSSCVFRKLNSALNYVLKDRAQQGLGVEICQAKGITEEQENYLWLHGFLGSSNGELLRDTLVFVFGMQFALRAGQEHRNLRRRNSQLSLQVDELGKEYLQYIEDISKTNNGGLAHLRIKRKVVRAYKNLANPERCPVELYKKYVSYVPTETSDNAFYLRALAKPKGEIWYYKKAVGRETLGNVVKKIMKNAGFERHYTNHSLRRSSASRLYDAGMPEQVIQETTGHRSSYGVKAYKCTSSSLKRKASEILQGNLPKTKGDTKSKSMDDKPTDCEVDECVLTGDSNQTLVIATTKTKICISYK